LRTGDQPLGVKAQIEGGVIFALSAALYGGVTLDKGGLPNPTTTTCAHCA
jgi:CO/xanthine dehydrogenase Mo-binding subunit